MESLLFNAGVYCISSKFLLEIADNLIAMGVRRVVRVIGASKKALLDFAGATRDVPGYETVYVPTMDEAERRLGSTSAPRKPDGEAENSSS